MKHRERERDHFPSGLPFFSMFIFTSIPHLFHHPIQPSNSRPNFRWSHRSLVVMFHGLNDSAACCATGVAKSWAKLPGVLVVPQQHGFLLNEREGCNAHLLGHWKLETWPTKTAKLQIFGDFEKFSRWNFWKKPRCFFCFSGGDLTCCASNFCGRSMAPQVSCSPFQVKIVKF